MAACTTRVVVPLGLWKADYQLMEDHHTKEPKDAEEVKEVQKVAKDVKGIQTMVRSLLFQA